MDLNDLYIAHCEVELHQSGLISMYKLFDTAEFHITDEDLRAVHRSIVGEQLWAFPGIGDLVHPDQYAGVYASNQDWLPERRRRSTQIATQVKEWCADLEKEIHERELAKKVDPFHLAAKYSLSLNRISPFATANGKMAIMVAVSIIRRYTGGAISLGNVPVAVEFCSSFMDSAFVNRKPAPFADYLFSETLESTKRAYAEYGKILRDDVERRQLSEIAEVDWNELVEIVNAGPSLQYLRSQDITHQLDDQKDLVKHPWAVYGKNCSIYEKLMLFLRDVQGRINKREEEESGSEATASDGDEWTSAEEDTPLTSTLGASSVIVSQTTHENDEDKIMKTDSSDEEGCTNTQPAMYTLTIGKRERQSQERSSEDERRVPKRQKM